MIIDALKIMLFGMIGIFFVMGLIIIFVQILNFFKGNGRSETDEEKDNPDE